MKHSNKMAIVGATLTLAAASGHAQLADKFYIGVDGGGAFQQDISIKNNTGFAPGGNIQFDTGFRAGLDLGYNVCDSFAVELETGLIKNDINQVGVQSLSSFSNGSEAELDEIPLLVNLIYKFPLKSSFKPYIGVGVGGMAGIFKSSNIQNSFFLGGNPTYKDTDYTFAYQAEAGFKYWLNQNIAFGVAYKFVGTTEHTWNDNSITLQTDGTMTQSIEATFTWRF